MNGPILNKLCMHHLRYFKGEAREEVIQMSVLESLEAGADPLLLDPKHVQSAARKYRNAETKATGKTSRYGGPRIKKLEEELASTTDSKRRVKIKKHIDKLSGRQLGAIEDAPPAEMPLDPLDVHAFVEKLSPMERRALQRARERGGVLVMPMGVKASIKKVAENVSWFPEVAMPAQRAATTSPETPAPTNIDIELRGRVYIDVNHCEHCGKGCWRCAPGEFRPPADLSKVRQVSSADAEVQDALMLTTWRKLFIANGKRKTARIPSYLFAFPLILDGRSIENSVLSPHSLPEITVTSQASL